MRDWQEPQPVHVPQALTEALGGHRLVGERLSRTGITTIDAARSFLDPAFYAPASTNDLPDIDRAVERLKRALRQQERILIWGDFDVDGQTATALLYSALKARGADVGYYVPNRFTDGHGMALPALKRQLDAGVDLILTCDTGISAHAAVELANARGVDTVITDHHTLPEALPDAAACVNPRRTPEGHPLRELPGVGVAWLLMRALFPNEDHSDLLDLVALGIVADVMVQVDDTRYLLQRGLDALRADNRLGIRALLERASIDHSALNEGHIGFALAPRLNALGRLQDANPAVELLTTSDWSRARQLANSLEGLNARRKFLSAQVYQSAMKQIENDPSLLNYAALVLSQSDWHPGVIGIVAGQLVEAFNRPVVMIAAPENLGRGSARSIAGVDITAAFDAVAEHLTSYGGHAMAAGLSLPAENIFAFRRALSYVVRGLIGDQPPKPQLQLDGYLSLDEISLQLARDLARLAPFGNGNPPLTLATRDVKITKRRQMGRGGDHLQLHVEDESGVQQRVIWWRGAGRDLPAGRFDLAYTLRVNDYRGKREALLEWLDCRVAADSAPHLESTAPAFDLLDYRASLTPEDHLAEMKARYPDALIWSEAESRPGAVSREGLLPSETLIVWTIPASAGIWESALATVNPQRLIVFGGRPDTESSATFLRRLMGLINYALNHKEGIAEPEALAAATSQRERAVQLGLQLLRALGKLNYRIDRAGRYHMRLTDGSPAANHAELGKRLDMQLRESRAWRDYWLTMPLSDDHRVT